MDFNENTQQAFLWNEKKRKNYSYIFASLSSTAVTYIITETLWIF